MRGEYVACKQQQAVQRERMVWRWSVTQHRRCALNHLHRPRPDVSPVRLVLAQNKRELLTNWWNEGKLEASEELGDMVSAAGDKDMALKIYQQCNASGKVRARWREGGCKSGWSRAAVRHEALLSSALGRWHVGGRLNLLLCTPSTWTPHRRLPPRSSCRWRRRATWAR